jgi:hypothetical protein
MAEEVFGIRCSNSKILNPYHLHSSKDNNQLNLKRCNLNMIKDFSNSSNLGHLLWWMIILQCINNLSSFIKIKCQWDHLHSHLINIASLNQ